jgi:hypothetical protein
VAFWLPGRELLRISRFDDRIEGIADLPEVGAPPGIARTSHTCLRFEVPASRAVSSQAVRHKTCDEFAQWMVEDASIGR